MTTGEVVAARRGDWEIVKTLRLAAVVDAPFAFGSSYDREAGRTADEWRDWIGPDDSAHDEVVFLARAGGRTAGLVGAFREDDITAHLIALWVPPDARRLGLGRDLVDAVVKWAAQRGLDRVTLDVADDNDAARALFQARGFEATGHSRALASAPDRSASEYEIRIGSR